MAKRLARVMLPLMTFSAIAAAALPSSGNASSRVVVGIGDGDPAMFSQPEFLRLHVETARDVVYWNVAVMKDKRYLHETRAWVTAAESDGIQPMISFAGNGNYVPGVAVYTRAIKAFLRDFPDVKAYTAWNEPDWIYRSLSRRPRLAAGYFNTLARYCHGCTVVAGDVYRPASQGLAAWVRSYNAGLRYRPAAWALHPYDDIRSHSTSQLRALESVTRGPIWFTEISGVLRRGHWPFPNQSGAAAARDERFLFSLPERFPRISRIYHYQWQGTLPSPHTGWDSGLLGPRGVPRPAYWVVYDAAHGKPQ